jgi:hypothetical protein
MNKTSSRAILHISAMIILMTLLVLVRPSGTTIAGRGFPDIPVTSTLNITGSVTPNPGTNYRVEGDGNGQYFNGVSSVSSILQGAINNPSRDWILDTRTSSTRTVLVDLRDPVPGSNATLLFSWQLLPTRVIVKCHETLAGSFPAIQLNQTVSCPMFVHFVFAGNDYNLGMSSGPGAPIDLPETNNALVTCTALNASNQCSAWTVHPITQADGTVRNIARLQTLCKRCPAGSGDFYVTFNFNVTNP